jgi:hypothetical protein
MGLILILAAPESHAEGFGNFMTLEGFTGLLDVPNAEVTDEGKVALLYSDQEESELRDRISREDSYIFSVGLLPNFELGGRITDAPPIRDLSANFKIKMPFVPEESILPHIAFGMQDAGGGATHFQTKYLVASKELWRLRFSLGYGTGPDRMDGVFGGLEIKAFDWLYLLGENDATETNVGIRLVTPEIKGWPVSLQVTAKSSLDYHPESPEYGIALQFPLGGDYHNRQPLPEKAEAVAPGESAGVTAATPPEVPVQSAAEPTLRTPAPEKVIAAEPEGDGGQRTADLSGSPLEIAAEATAMATAPKQTEKSRASLLALRDKLVAGGFVNVRVGMDPEALYAVVEYENSRYNHNELDGLGMVIGSAVDTLGADFEVLQLIVKAKGIRMLQLKAPLADFRRFLQDQNKEAQLNTALEITPKVEVNRSVRFIDENANPSLLKSELLLYPGLTTLVASDFGNFDYLLSLKPDYYLNLWKGAVANARWDIPLDWSQVFDTGQPYGNTRKSSQFERLMLFQALKVSPTMMVNLGGGEVYHDSYGTLNELMWTPGNGDHRFVLTQAYLSNTDSGVPDEKQTVYLGSYRYYFSPTDLYLVGTAGRFLDQDSGYKVELKRFFGDTAFSVYFKDSTTEKDEHVQMGGVQLSIPLTPRRDMKPRIVQVKGDNDWRYSQETKIVSPGEANLLSTSIGVIPLPLNNLERVYYNRDRLTEEYIRGHLLRLRDAYLTYR